MLTKIESVSLFYSPFVLVRTVQNCPTDLPGDNSKVRATWIGHSTVLVEVGETVVITDPMFRRVRNTVPNGCFDYQEMVYLCR